MTTHYPANTLERFEALPREIQESKAKAAGYPSLEAYKQRHFAVGTPDVNKVREQVVAQGLVASLAEPPEPMGPHDTTDLNALRDKVRDGKDR